MSTFAKKSFDAVKYAASRPSYPPALYLHVLNYAAPSPSPLASRTVLDLGCGPGLSTFAFLPHFSSVIGLDPSKGMVDAANEILAEKVANDEVGEGKSVVFRVGSGENLEGIQDRSVDLVVAGQAAHWFNTEKVYPELARVLKPGGAFVFWGYGEFYLPNHPKASALIPPYSGGNLAQYWQQPGRSIVESLLVPLPFPTLPAFNPSSFHRSFFAHSPPPLPASQNYTTSTHPLLLTHSWTIDEIQGYLRTFSAANTYDEAHGAGSDIGGEFGEKLRKVLEEEEGVGAGERVDVAWRMGTVEAKVVG